MFAPLLYLSLFIDKSFASVYDVVVISSLLVQYYFSQFQLLLLFLVCNSHFSFPLMVLL